LDERVAHEEDPRAVAVLRPQRRAFYPVLVVDLVIFPPGKRSEAGTGVEALPYPPSARRVIERRGEAYRPARCHERALERLHEGESDFETCRDHATHEYRAARRAHDPRAAPHGPGSFRSTCDGQNAGWISAPFPGP